MTLLTLVVAGVAVPGSAACTLALLPGAGLVPIVWCVAGGGGGVRVSPRKASLSPHECVTVDWVSVLGEARDWAVLDGLLARLDAERAAFPESAEIEQEVALAAHTVTIAACKAGDWPRADAMRARLDGLLAAFPKSAEIAKAAALAAGLPMS